MTFLGKLFVMLNLILSILMAAAAFAAYAGGIDWSDKGKTGQPPGKMVALVQEGKEKLSELATAENSFRTNRAALLTQEVRRQADRQWYNEKLRELVDGKERVDVITFNGGLPKLDAQQRPELVKDPDLFSFQHYVDELAGLRMTSSDLQKQVKAKVEEDRELTNQIIGVPERRGLTQKISEEQVKTMGLLAELGIVTGLQVNVEVESELVKKRLETLDARIQELVRYLKRKHKVEASGKWR